MTRLNAGALVLKALVSKALVPHAIIVGAVSLATLLFAPTASAQYKEAIGFNKLLAEKGASLEDGTGVVVSMVEAPQGTGADGFPRFLPDANLTNPNHPQFSGKTFVDGSGGSSEISTHSRGTGFYFFGNTLSISSGVTDVTVFEANHYINTVLNASTNNDPFPQNFKVQNHSWIGNLANGSDVPIVMQRFDFVADTGDITMVVGVNNGSGNPLPDLLSHSYNAISVGRTDGNHSAGVTSNYGPGRTKPDIVAPQSTTSRATATVSSAAALMHEATMGTNAGRSEVIKAMLMAGATKEEFANWDRTTTRPLDERFGAGELNIYNSYKIFEAGQVVGTTGPPTEDAGTKGWDYNSEIAAGSSVFYEFNIADGSHWEDFSILLTWNMEIVDNDPSILWSPAEILANMDMILRDESNSIVDQSLSTVDNVEHIYLTSLGPGTYTLEITSDLARDYGLAWRATAIPEPGSASIIVIVGVAFLARRKRRA